MSDIEASGLVPSGPVEIFAFLSDLENHWRLADRFIEVLSLERSSAEAPAHGGRVRMRGPLGVSRTAVTEVAMVAPPHEMRGTGRIGRRTSGRVAWRLMEEGTGTRVHLSAGIENASPLDRALLVLGGRGWLERRFRDVLRRLAERFSEDAEAPRFVSTSRRGRGLVILGEAAKAAILNTVARARPTCRRWRTQTQNRRVPTSGQGALPGALPAQARRPRPRA